MDITDRREKKYRLAVLLKLGLIAIAGVYGITCAVDPEDYGLLDWLDLAFHEAGHLMFGLSGIELITVIGGTFMQLVMPALLAASFILKGRGYPASVTGVWLAQSLFNVSIYVKDAWTMDLPLLGKEGGIHDWNYMLVEFDLLVYERFFAGLLYATGLLILIASITAGIFYGIRKIEEPKPPERRPII